MAYVDRNACISDSDHQYRNTVRTSKCHFLHTVWCPKCTNYVSYQFVCPALLCSVMEHFTKEDSQPQVCVWGGECCINCSLVPRLRGGRGKAAWYTLFAHVSKVPKIWVLVIFSKLSVKQTVNDYVNIVSCPFAPCRGRGNALRWCSMLPCTLCRR